MKRKRLFSRVAQALAGGLAVVALAAALPARAATYTATTIFSFSTPALGQTPMGGVVADSQGRLYGTTVYGGVAGYGIVYRLDPPPAGQTQWTEEILCSFTNKDGDGEHPESAVVLGADGSIYGTKYSGSAHGLGTVYKLLNAPGWPKTILHSFENASGVRPNTPLTFGADGLLYGATSFTKRRHAKSAPARDFRLSPMGNSVLYEVINKFPNNDFVGTPVGLTYLPILNAFVGGLNPYAMELSQGGSLYAFQQRTDGTFKVPTLYTFGQIPDVNDPATPPTAGHGPLANAAFGCALGGGASGDSQFAYPGGVYEIVPNEAGGFTESVIFNFPTSATPGAFASPGCSLVQKGLSKTLIGITDGSSVAETNNTLFGLTAPETPGGPWTEENYLAFSRGGLLQYPLAVVGDSIFVAFGSGGGGFNGGDIVQLSPLH